ncbi:helicase-associated domain-containing protein [Corynebacterium propinquum]|uniref:helicase-associated domain-containing protein n=1 Tax=Corynebacterium propinquum TaxID=43769 RepID=UPI0006673CD7|nr:helicase-associated domain-containing protein [Corynebacterium propinquum]MCT1818632.1 helicase-associated domain-containing protein [Corynebacterium propinquum]WKS48844.1 helicase-associated domain-containing protein [Corynebacterium propinquum]
MADHPITRSPAELVEQWLHSRTNQQLATVLQARSDIAIPQPHDLHTLAHRLLLPASLARAIEQRNATELAILEALLAAGAHTQPVSRKDVIGVLAGTQLENAHQDPPPRADASVEGNASTEGNTSAEENDAVDVDEQHSVTATNSTADLLSQTLQQLRDHALVFAYPATEKTPIAEDAADTEDSKDAEAPEDTFLMWIPARVDKLLSHRDRILYQESVPADVVDKLPEKHQEILRRIHAGGGLGTTKHARSDDPEHPITQMVNSGVLRAIDDSTVTLPVSVNRILSGLPATDVHLLPSSRISPELWDSDAAVAAHYLPARNPSESELSADSSDSATTPQETTDSGATATGLEACREISSLLDFLGTHPVPMLKNGGLGQRSSKLLAQHLELTTAEVYRVVALAHAAGVIGTGEPHPLPAEGEGNYLAPTRRADEWQEADLPTRWTMLLRGWLDSLWPWWTLLPDTGGTTQFGGTEAHQRLLHPEFSHHRLAFYRRLVVRGYARSSARVPITAHELWQDLLFLYPKLITQQTQTLLTPLLQEAEWVGAISNGRLSTPALALLADEEPTDPVLSAAHKLCPAAVSEFIVQADFTVMCPGPLEYAVRSELELIAKLESSGLASLYRIEESSVRRGLDAGRSGEQIIAFLREHSLTPVPDSMISVIRELARHHGGLRGGPAVSYLRCDDPETLDLLEHSAVAEEIAIHRIAPTVLISQRPLAAVVQVLAQHNFYAVAEDSSGHGVDIRLSPARVPQPRAKPTSAPRVDAARIAGIVDKLGSHDRGSSAGSSTESSTVAGVASPQTPRKTASINTTSTSRASTSAAPATSTAEISNTVELAQRSGRLLAVGYANKSGERQQVRATVLSIFGGNVDIRVAGDGSVRRIPLHRIIDVAHAD